MSLEPVVSAEVQAVEGLAALGIRDPLIQFLEGSGHFRRSRCRLLFLQLTLLLLGFQPLFERGHFLFQCLEFLLQGFCAVRSGDATAPSVPALAAVPSVGGTASVLAPHARPANPASISSVRKKAILRMSVTSAGYYQMLNVLNQAIAKLRKC